MKKGQKNVIATTVRLDRGLGKRWSAKLDMEGVDRREQVEGWVRQYLGEPAPALDAAERAFIREMLELRRKVKPETLDAFLCIFRDVAAD